MRLLYSNALAPFCSHTPKHTHSISLPQVTVLAHGIHSDETPFIFGCAATVPCMTSTGLSASWTSTSWSWEPGPCACCANDITHDQAPQLFVTCLLFSSCMQLLHMTVLQEPIFLCEILWSPMTLRKCRSIEPASLLHRKGRQLLAHKCLSKHALCWSW